MIVRPFGWNVPAQPLNVGIDPAPGPLEVVNDKLGVFFVSFDLRHRELGFAKIGLVTFLSRHAAGTFKVNSSALIVLVAEASSAFAVSP